MDIWYLWPLVYSNSNAVEILWEIKQFFFVFNDLMFVFLMVFNATFNNISVISWRSVLLVEETTNLSQVTDKLYHIMLYTSHWSRFELTTLVVIGTDCIVSCKIKLPYDHSHDGPVNDLRWEVVVSSCWYYWNII